MIALKYEKFKVKTPILLSNFETLLDLKKDKAEIENQLERVRKSLGKLQDTLYAHGKYAVLICLQGMDTSGKDSLIREVFKDFNSRGIVVHSFKVPSSLERDHDYMSCYQEAINKSSKPHAPWYIIPADDKPAARYLIARIFTIPYNTLKTLKNPN